MSGDSDMEAVQDLKCILTQERQFLIAGQLEDATFLMRSKLDALAKVEQIVTRLEQGQVRREIAREIQSVVEQSKENGLHFQAVRNGLHRTIARLETMTDNAQVGAYDVHGSQLAFTGAIGGYQKRI